MHLTAHTDYALRVFIYLLSQPERRVTAREVAEAYRISYHHVAKVAKMLTQKGWLRAARGSGGGLELAPHVPEMKVGEIVRELERTDLAECFQPALNTCPIHRCCQLKAALFQARQAFFAALNQYTVRDLVGDPAPLQHAFWRAAS